MNRIPRTTGKLPPSRKRNEPSDQATSDEGKNVDRNDGRIVDTWSITHQELESFIGGAFVYPDLRFLKDWSRSVGAALYKAPSGQLFPGPLFERGDPP